MNRKYSPINNNNKNRPSSQQVNNNYNRYNNNNKNKEEFSKGNKKNRYQNMFGDEPKSNNNVNKNNNRPVTRQQENKYYGNRFNNINNNNRNRNANKPVVVERGWFKKNYPDFKYKQPKRAPNCKVNYGKINYNDYCAKNKIDKGRNYHYYRENGYYNYNNAMKDYRIRQKQGQANRYGFNAKPDNIYKAMQFGKNNGPNIVNIKK